MPMSPQDIFKKYKRQSLGMPKASPSSSTKISGPVSVHYIFIASYAMCCSWSVFVFVFSLSLVQFDVVLGQIPGLLFWRETRSVFIAQNTLVSFLLLCECSLFASAAFSIRFCSELFSSSLQLGVFNSLVFVEYCSCDLFQKRLIGVGFEKKGLYANSGTESSLCRL